LKQGIAALELVPSGGGCFEVSVNSDLVYSKLQTGEFPEKSDVLRRVREHAS
jgi:selenoprotein W-related protein